MMCAGFMAACWWVGKRRNFPRDTEKLVGQEFLKMLAYASPALLLPVLIIIFLRFGIATPTEVAILSTLYSGLVSVFLYKDLGWKRLNHAVINAGLATGVVLLVIMASAAIGWLLTFDQMPNGIVEWAKSNLSQGWMVILMMNLLMLVCGMFIDLPAAVLLLTPVFVPLATQHWHGSHSTRHHDDRESGDWLVHASGRYDAIYHQCIGQGEGG